MADDQLIDQALVPFREQVEALCRIPLEEKELTSPDQRVRIEEITVEMPVELDVVPDAHGCLQLGSSPPLYYANTSIQPVFHFLRIRIAAEKRKQGGTIEQAMEP